MAVPTSRTEQLAKASKDLMLRIWYKVRGTKIMVTTSSPNPYISLNPQRTPQNFEYILTYDEGIKEFNKLQIGKEYQFIDHVTGEWKKQIYQPPNEQETMAKMMHGIRFGWIKP
jgi:hypothetical protein